MTAVIAEELCIRAVNTIPISKRRKGLLILARKFLTGASVWKYPIASLIISRPMNSIPRYASIEPIFLIFAFADIIMNAPTPASIARKSVTFRLCSDTRKPVTVVPMLAPIMMGVACIRVIIPAFTKPSTMTVVAEELWITAVTAVPIPTPTNFLFDILSNIFRSLLPATASRLRPKAFIAMRKTPRPPKKSNTLLTISINTSRV